MKLRIVGAQGGGAACSIPMGCGAGVEMRQAGGDSYVLDARGVIVGCRGCGGCCFCSDDLASLLSLNRRQYALVMQATQKELTMRSRVAASSEAIPPPPSLIERIRRSRS